MANRPYLTRAERDTLKRAVDARVRALYVTLPGDHECAGCGRPHSDPGGTTGCGQCADRLQRRRRREDPVLQELDRRRWRESKQRRRAAQLARQTA